MVIFGYIRWSKEIWEKDERSRIMEVLISRRSNLENELYARIYYTKSVAAYISLHPDVTEEEFHNLASELVGADSVINSMSISPSGVISAVYPTRGHEAAIGLDLLDHPARRKIVEQTIHTGRTYVAGPVELVEGGIAFISYTPIFDKTGDIPWEFWGMTDIVIFRDSLFEAAGLSSNEGGAQIALRGYDGLGAGGEVFFGDPAVFDDRPVQVTVQLPDGEWILAGVPLGGWAGYLDQDLTMVVILVGSSIVIAILIGILVGAFLKLRASRQQLRALNEDKNRLISIIAHDLRSPVAAVSSLSKELLEPGESALSGEMREIAGLLQASSEDSLMLLENLLDWVRSRERGEFTRNDQIDLGKLTFETASLFQSLARNRSVEIDKEIPEGILVYGDPRILQTILRNLISNAVKFSPTGGQVKIGLLSRDENEVKVYVRDFGRGMRDQQVARILRGEGDGSSGNSGHEPSSGLGLSLCRDLLARCGQSMYIDSELGVGTTVSFTFPVILPAK